MTRPAAPADREALEFLAGRFAPQLARSHRTALARAVRAARDAGSLGRLATLTEPQRRELLQRLEAESPADVPSPRALVRLAEVLAALPAPEEGFGRRLALPAR